MRESKTDDKDTDLLLDMLTVYTVNHLETIPALLNRTLHLLFYMSICSVLYIVFIYIIALIDEGKRSLIKSYQWVKWPPVIPYIIMCCLPIEYEVTEKGNYSVGPAMVMLFFIIIYYFLLSLCHLWIYRKRINQKKKQVIVGALFIWCGGAIYQAIVPTSLISGFGATLLCLAFFLTVENPDAHLLEALADEKEKAEGGK